MHLPSHFRIEEPAKIRSFLRENSFGLLLSREGGVIHDTHTPFVQRDDGTLVGHIARANPQCRNWNGNVPVKVVFRGPHTYISPRFYASDFNVPTWNYTAVSISGTLSVIEDVEQALDVLDELAAIHEPDEKPWVLDRSVEGYRKLLSAIVVFSVRVDSMEAAFKLNQNKSREDQRSVIDALRASGSHADAEVADLMEANLDSAGL